MRASTKRTLAGAVNASLFGFISWRTDHDWIVLVAVMAICVSSLWWGLWDEAAQSEARR